MARVERVALFLASANRDQEVFAALPVRWNPAGAAA